MRGRCACPSQTHTSTIVIRKGKSAHALGQGLGSRTPSSTCPQPASKLSARCIIAIFDALGGQGHYRINIGIESHASHFGVFDGAWSIRGLPRTPGLSPRNREAAGECSRRITARQSKFPYKAVHADSRILLEIRLLLATNKGGLVHFVNQVKREEDNSTDDRTNEGLDKAESRRPLPTDVIITPFNHSGPHT